MPTITSTGVGSGLNVNSLVTQLVAAERGPYDARIGRAEARVTTEFTALAQLKGAMSSLQSALADLRKPETFLARKVTTGTNDFFTASATADAAPGSYQVEVRQLAKSAQLGSAGITGGAAAVAGVGTLAITQGSTTFTVTLGATDNTLADLRDAINSATGNPGIAASLVTDVNGTHLVIGSALTGAANSLSITTTDGDANLTRFVHNPPTLSNMTELQAAQDAIVFVSGYEIHDADNAIDTAIDGVTLNLTKEETGTLTSLGISLDQAGVRSRAERFVSAYNVLASQISKLRSYDPETRAAGPLLGDAMLRGIETQMRRILSDSVAGQSGSPYTSLASIGITTNKDGTLALDATRFDAAMAVEPTVASRIFASDGGVANRLADFLEQKLGSGSELSARDTRIAERRKDITRQKESLETRMEQIQARYLKQFNALDSLLTQLQSTSSFLAQQLASLPGQNS